MKYSLLLLLFLCGIALGTQAQDEDFLESNQHFRSEINHHYADSVDSPLTEKDRLEFDSLPFFPINSEYYVNAKLERIQDAEPFEMKTTTDRLPMYRKYAIATFEIKDSIFQLTLFQGVETGDSKVYDDYLFLPFNDLTNGIETYGGGRFIDLDLPTEKTDSIQIDFNKAYNPYCAYNHNYSCPIPPSENSLNTMIKAGVRYY